MLPAVDHEYEIGGLGDIGLVVVHLLDDQLWATGSHANAAQPEP